MNCAYCVCELRLFVPMLKKKKVTGLSQLYTKTKAARTHHSTLAMTESP